jgi:hypothetical protein
MGSLSLHDVRRPNRVSAPAEPNARRAPLTTRGLTASDVFCSAQTSLCSIGIAAPWMARFRRGAQTPLDGFPFRTPVITLMGMPRTRQHISGSMGIEHLQEQSVVVALCVFGINPRGRPPRSSACDWYDIRDDPAHMAAPP